jgi:molecular chaperone GrpE
MSGEPNEDTAAAPAAEPTSDAASGAETGADDSGVLPVEVEAPDAVATLEAKVATLEKEKKENWDRYLRSAADLENLRKRNKREAEDAKFDAKQKVLKEMLPVVDNLERAIEHASAGGEGEKPHRRSSASR